MIVAYTGEVLKVVQVFGEYAVKDIDAQRDSVTLTYLGQRLTVSTEGDIEFNAESMKKIADNTALSFPQACELLYSGKSIRRTNMPDGIGIKLVDVKGDSFPFLVLSDGETFEQYTFTSIDLFTKWIETEIKEVEPPRPEDL